ncbi:kinesin light chain [Trichonephila clavata]|uniref:Kinesin light chain n=1 Tax=Trichonephila clavata TaxID=2740835 RepID=A0A8X6HC77_TRICU|nr:kinesin light chain [Trichonephila clavata]
MRLLKWREKKHPNWKTEIPRPTLDRDKIVEETKNAMKYLENLHDEYKRILDQLLEQLPTLSECGDDKNSLIKQKVDFLKKNLIVIERGLADSQIFLTLNNIVENIENEVRESEDEIGSLRERIKALKLENNTLRRDLSVTQRKLIESEELSASLEVERDHLAFMNSLLCEEPCTEETSDDGESIDLSFIDEKAADEVEGSFPNLPCLVEIDFSLNPRLKIFYNLVMGYIAKGSYEIAAPLCKTTLQDLQEKYGPNHPDVVAMMDIITIVYRGMRRYKDAAKIQLEVLEIKKKTLSKNDISIAFTLNNLSAFYGKTGKVEEAEKFCRKAVEFRKRVLGNNHVDVGKQLCNLAAICCHTKQYNEALECYKEAIDIFSRTIGPENSYTMKTKNNLASLYVETEHYKEAEKLYKEILSAMPKESEVKTDDDASIPEKIDRNAIKDHDSVSDNQKQGNISTKSFTVEEVMKNLKNVHQKSEQMEEPKELSKCTSHQVKT